MLDPIYRQFCSSSGLLHQQFVLRGGVLLMLLHERLNMEIEHGRKVHHFGG